MVAPIKLNSLQFIRAIAALSVVYLHLETPFSVGHFGVDLFFVLSGFVMAMVVQNDRNPVNFFIGRITRIAPLYWIFTLFVFFIALAKPQLLQNTVADFNSLIYSLLFIPYFKAPNNITPIYSIGWTLMFEMAFYIIVVLSLIISNKFFRKMNISLLISTVILTIYVICHILPANVALVVLLKSPNILEFLLGILAFEIMNKFSFQEADRKIKMYYLPLIIILIGIMCVLETDYLRLRLFVFGIPSFLILIMIVRLEDEINALPSLVKNTLIAIGDASYSIYLVNIFVIIGFKKIITPYAEFINPSSTLIGGIVAFVTCVLAGLFIHHYIDKPMMKFARGLINRVKSLPRPYFPQMQSHLSRI